VIYIVFKWTITTFLIGETLCVSDLCKRIRNSYRNFLMYFLLKLLVVGMLWI
jgi:hypothetical protein